jgi:hypothetical protein
MRLGRSIQVALVILGLAAGLVGGASATGPSGAIRCGTATPIDPSAPLGRAAPLGRILWLAIYPFQPGYPTKTIVMSQRRIGRPIAIRGWNCISGNPLRFWYREGEPFLQVPVTALTLRRRGDFRVRFGPWPTGAMRGGYSMFWRAGLWKVVAYRDGRKIATAIVRTTAD